MNGKLCVVTGATSGIGFEVARSLAQMGAQVVGVGRDPVRCAEAARRISIERPKGEVTFEVADLSSRAEVRALAERIAARGREVDVLINNAGLFTWGRREGPDGIELQFAVNYLAAFQLTGLLLPHLAAQARVIMVSSDSHFFGRIHWRNLGMHRLYNGLSAYSQSKLATVLFAYELARRLAARGEAGEGTSGAPQGEPGGSPAAPIGARGSQRREATITTFAADPGLVRTKIGEKHGGPLVAAFWRLRARRGISPEQSAASIVFLASNPLIAGLSGRYWYMDEPRPSSKRSYDAQAAARLWNISEALCGLHYLSDPLQGRRGTGKLTA